MDMSWSKFWEIGVHKESDMTWWLNNSPLYWCICSVVTLHKYLLPSLYSWNLIIQDINNVLISTLFSLYTCSFRNPAVSWAHAKELPSMAEETLQSGGSRSLKIHDLQPQSLKSVNLFVSLWTFSLYRSVSFKILQDSSPSNSPFILCFTHQRQIFLFSMKVERTTLELPHL